MWKKDCIFGREDGIWMNVYFIFMDLFYIKNIFLSIIVFNLFSFNSIYFILNKKKKELYLGSNIFIY